MIMCKGMGCIISIQLYIQIDILYVYLYLLALSLSLSLQLQAALVGQAGLWVPLPPSSTNLQPPLTPPLLVDRVKNNLSRSSKVK